MISPASPESPRAQALREAGNILFVMAVLVLVAAWALSLTLGQSRLSTAMSYSQAFVMIGYVVCRLWHRRLTRS